MIACPWHGSTSGQRSVACFTLSPFPVNLPVSSAGGSATRRSTNSKRCARWCNSRFGISRCNHLFFCYSRLGRQSLPPPHHSPLTSVLGFQGFGPARLLVENRVLSYFSLSFLFFAVSAFFAKVLAYSLHVLVTSPAQYRTYQLHPQSLRYYIEFQGAPLHLPLPHLNHFM